MSTHIVGLYFGGDSAATLCCNTRYIGLALPRLLRAAGCDDATLEVVPVTLSGREALEAIVPVTYFTRYAHHRSLALPSRS